LAKKTCQEDPTADAVSRAVRQALVDVRFGLGVEAREPGLPGGIEVIGRYPLTSFPVSIPGALV